LEQRGSVRKFAHTEFASAPIVNARVEAHKRGVKIHVILDRSQRTEKYSSADFVAHAGIPPDDGKGPDKPPNKTVNDWRGRDFTKTRIPGAQWKFSVFGVDEVFAHENGEQVVTFCCNSGALFFKSLAQKH
jgi:hypothetical protein